MRPEHGGCRQRAAVLDAVLAAAEELDTGPVQVALAWLRSRAAHAATSMTLIVGPRSLTHLEGHHAALDVELEPVHYQQFNEVSAPQLGAPHDDVAAALTHGVDGNRDLLNTPAVPIA